MFFSQKGPVPESMAPGKDQRPTGAKLLAQIVKENCSVDFQGTPQDDLMERLLRNRKG